MVGGIRKWAFWGRCAVFQASRLRPTVAVTTDSDFRPPKLRPRPTLGPCRLTSIEVFARICDIIVFSFVNCNDHV